MRSWATRAVGLPPQIDFERPVERTRATRVFMAYGTEFQRPALETDELSVEGTPEVRGFFTQVLIKGLRGDAAGEGGVVIAASLKKYLEAATERLALGRKFYQHANVIDGFAGATRFGKSIRRAKLRISFGPLESKEAEMVLYGPHHEVVMRGSTRSGPWELIGDPSLPPAREDTRQLARNAHAPPGRGSSSQWRVRGEAAAALAAIVEAITTHAVVGLMELLPSHHCDAGRWIRTQAVRATPAPSGRGFRWRENGRRR